MPIYEYLCSECKSKFEQMRPLSQSGKSADCPKCHNPARRKMSTFAAFTTTASGVPTPNAAHGGQFTTITSQTAPGKWWQREVRGVKLMPKVHAKAKEYVKEEMSKEFGRKIKGKR